jgi:integrase
VGKRRFRDVKVSEFFAVWGDLPRGRSAETQAHNRLMVKPFVRRFGGREIGDIGPDDAASYMREFPSHARYARTMMEDMRRGHLIDRNPFEGLRLPSSPGRRDIDVLSEEQVWQLVDAAGDVYSGVFAVRFQGLLAVSAFSGIRACGAAGLRERDVDMRGAPVTLRVSEKGGKVREVSLIPERAVSLLSDALAHADGGLVFRGKRGQALNRWAIRRALEPVRADAGFTWHQLRHFTASWMIDRGAQPIDCAIQLHGSTQPDVVLRYYTHASREESRKRLLEVCA